MYLCTSCAEGLASDGYIVERLDMMVELFKGIGFDVSGVFES